MAPVPDQSAVATLLNVVLRWVPTDVTAVMMATEISAAMRPYSMAVAPYLSEKNLAKNLRMDDDSLVDGASSRGTPNWTLKPQVKLR